jgi:hypothetical protein
MAQLGSYAQALGELARESAVGGLKGLAQGAKYAAMREMPALSAGVAFAKDMRGRATKIEESKSKETGKRQVAATENLVRQQATNNVISLDMVRQLRQINAGVTSQQMMMRQQLRTAQKNDQFAEEEARERADFNKKLLKSLDKMGGGAGGAGSSGSGGAGGGFFDSLMGSLGQNIGDILQAAATAYGGYKIAKRLPGGGGGRGGGKGGGRGPYRDPKTGRFSKRPPGLFRRGIGALGALGRGVALNPLSKVPGWGWAASGIGLGLSFAPDIYDYFAGPPGGDMDVTSQDRQNALSRAWLTRFLSGGADRRAKIEAASRIRKQRYQRPTPYAKGSYVLGDESRRANPGTPGSSPSPSTSTNPPINIPSSVSKNIQDQIIQIESGGNYKAAAGTSSAYGLGQFTRGTFEDLAKRAQPGDPLYGKSFDDYKVSPALQRAALSKLTQSNAAGLQRRKLPVDDVSIYLAHFLGEAGAARVLGAPDNTPIEKVVSANAIKANAAVFKDVKTVGDLKAWAKRKLARAQRALGTSSPAAAAAADTGPLQQAANAGSTTLPEVTVSAPAFSTGMRGGINVPGAPVTPVTGTGTSVARISDAPIKVVDEKANENLDDIKKSQGKVEKETKGLAVSSKLAARNFIRRERPSRRILSPEEEADEYLRKAQQGFLNAFDKTLTKALNTFATDFLKKTGYTPGGKTVTAQEAMRVGYAGQQLGKALDIDKKTANALEKLLGKEYGRMLSPAVSQLGKAYLNSMAIGVGQSLFKGIGGFDANTSKAITGQIIGNFAKGNKQVAMEQLLYGLTGVATGPETIAQDFGFKSAAEGIGYMAEVFAAKSTNYVQGLFGWEDRTQAQRVRDPVTGQLYTPGEGLFGNVAMPPSAAAGNYGGIMRREAAQTLKTSQMTSMVGKSNNLLTEGAATLNGVLLVSVVNAGEFASDDEKFKQQMLGGLTAFTTTGIKNVMDGSSIGTGIFTGTPGFNPAYGMAGGRSSPYSLSQGAPDLSLSGNNKYGMVGTEVAYNIESQAQTAEKSFLLAMDGQKIQLGTTNTISQGTQATTGAIGSSSQEQILSSQQNTQAIVGAIQSMPRGGGVGGGTGIPGFSTGNPFADFAVSMGTSFVTNKLTEKIKNPYLKSIANFGLNYAAQKYLLPSIFGSAAATAGGAAGAAGGMGGALSLGSLGAGGIIGGLGATIGGGLTNFATWTGSQALGQLGVGLQYGINPFGQQAAMLAAQNAGLASGVGAVVGEVLPYAGSLIHLAQGQWVQAATSAAGTYVGSAIGTAILPGIGTALGGLVGSLLGSVVGGMFGKKKKAPPAKRIDKMIGLIEMDIAKKVVTVDENGPPDSMRQLADALLNTGFNTAISIYQVSKVMPYFRYIYVSIVNNKLRVALPGESYGGGRVDGGWVYDVEMSDKKNAQFYMLEVMRKIREEYKSSFKEQDDMLKKIDDGYKLVSSKSANQLAGGLISSLKYGKYAIGGTEYTMGATSGQAQQSYVLGDRAGRSVVGTTTGITVSSSTTSAGSLTPTSGTVTAIQLTPTASTGAGGASGTGQNVTVVTDNSTKNVEGSTINTTYLTAGGGGADPYGRSGVNTSMPVVV